jgi:hypothetical protein
MKIYVETNFLVESALAQEEYATCEEILSLSERGAIRLIFPAFCVPEAYHALVGRHRERVRFSNQLDDQLVQLRRSATFNASAELAAVQRSLTTSTQDEEGRFRSCVNPLIASARLVPLTPETLKLSRSWQDKSGLKLPDSLVLASVILDLQGSQDDEGCFVTRDKDLTEDPDITSHLRSLKCELKHRFVAGLGYIRARISKS